MKVARHYLAALVDEHLDGDWQHEIDVERLELDGSAEAKRGVDACHTS